MRIASLALFLGVFASARAGDREGNGADGMAVGGSLYLLDLVEAGVELAPHAGPEGTDHPQLTALAANALAGSGLESEAPAVGRKLAELARHDALLAYSTARALGLYHWALVNNPLAEVDDTEDTAVEIPRDGLVQIAVRRSRSIRVGRTAWEMLAKGHRAALILHEVLYALVMPEMRPTGLYQDSRRARELVGYLFSKAFATRGAAGLQAVVGKDWPFLREITRYRPIGGDKVEEFNWARVVSGPLGREYVLTWPRVVLRPVRDDESEDAIHVAPALTDLPPARVDAAADEACTEAARRPVRAHLELTYYSVDFVGSSATDPPRWSGFSHELVPLATLPASRAACLVVVTDALRQARAEMSRRSEL